MKRKKRKSRWKKRLYLTGVGVSVVLLALALYMAFRADCLLPEGMYRQLVPVTQEDMDPALPKGSLAVVNELETPHERGVAAYQTSDGQVAFGRVKEETVEGYTLGFDQEDETFQVERKQVLGAVGVYVSGLGGLVTVLSTYRLTLAATWPCICFSWWPWCAPEAPAAEPNAAGS